MCKGPAPTSLRFSTRELPPARRLPALRELFDRSVQLEVETAPGHAVEMEMLQAPGLRRARMLSALTARLSRPAPMLADGEDTVCLMIKTAGRMRIVQGTREGVPDLGDGVLLVYRAPAILDFDDASYISIRVPFDALAPMVRADEVAGRRIGADNEALALLRAYAMSLPDALADPTLSRLAAQHVYDLIALAIGATGEGRDLASQRSVRVARRQAVQADVMADVTLDLATVAVRQGVSPRYIQMLFDETGTTFSAFVYEQRLEKARRLLTSPRFDTWSIAEIALEAGFSDLSHFNRRFKQRYLMTPTNMRRGGES